MKLTERSNRLKIRETAGGSRIFENSALVNESIAMAMAVKFV